MLHTYDVVRRSRMAGEFTLPGAESHYPPDLSIEPIHLDVDLHVDVDAESIHGTVTHTLRGRSEGARRLVLHAVDFEGIEVTCPDAGAAHASYDGRKLCIDLEPALAPGEERRVAIAYHVTRPVTGLFFSHPTDDAPDRATYAATDHETERARHWLPTIDLPNVRPTLAFHLRAREDLTILANGTLEREERHGDGTKTAHWNQEEPCPSYLTCFAIGDFVRFDDGEHEGRPLAYFTSRYFRSEDLERSFGRTGEMMAWMEERLDHPFPYPKYFQFALPGFGGAMENISLVSWDDIFVLDETLAKEWTWLVDQINVHEMAHSYFGDMVVCRDYAHAWLKESWATYVESLWLEHARGAEEAAYNLYANVDAYTKESDEAYARPIVTRTFNHSWQMYDRHLYPGGAARLHMLRKDLGDAAFFRGVHLYLKRFAHKVVETDDFRRCLEEASGRSLGKFFDQWIHAKGYPKLKATFAWDAKRGEGTFTVEQTQADPKAGIGLFDLPLDLGWTIDGVSDRLSVTLEKAKHVVVVSMPKEPEQVRVDPESRLVKTLEFNPGVEKLRRQLTDAPDVVGRILAANELCGTGKAKNLDAVRDAYRREAFWGARIRFATALAKAGTQTAVDALAALVREEQDPMVLETLFRQAGTLRAPEIRAALTARLDAGLGLYRATQAAYEALGAQRAEAPLDRLLEAARHADKYGVEQAGAFRGLAGSRREEAVEALEQATRPGGSPDRARPSALRALGVLGRFLGWRRRQAIREHLEGLLRDDVDRVRIAAVQGLRGLGDVGAIPALLAFRASLSDQEQVGVDRAVQALRAGAKPAPKAAEKALDEVRTTIRSLEDRLQKLEARAEADERGNSA